MKEPIFYLIKTFLKNRNILIDEVELEFQLRSHPSYPSLHSVTGVLDHFAVKNYALEVPKNLETLIALPNTFLAYIQDDKMREFALVSATNNGFQLAYDDRNKQVLSIDDFIKVWSGIILVIDESDTLLLPQIKKTYFTCGNMFLSILIILSVYFLFRTTMFPALHFILSLAGFGICVLILYHELGIDSLLLNKICSEENKGISCESVLNSKGANIFGTINLGDIGIIYFVTLILSWLLLKISNNNYDLLILISLITIPFTFYSVYYQYFIVKKWCPLCLGVVVILLLQVCSILIGDINIGELSIKPESLFMTVFCLIISIVLWQFALTKFRNEKELNSMKIVHYRFIRNYNIFKSLIIRKQQIVTDIPDINELTFCNSNEIPLLNIVVVTSPLCGFCKEVHAIIESLLDMKGKRISITIRFSVRENTDSPDTKIALRLLEIINNDGPEKCLEAMHDIYGDMKPDHWLLKWEEAKDSIYLSILSVEREWCKALKINFTPEILINGRSFPIEYNRNDLLYFIDDILEEEHEKLALLT